MGKVGKLNSNEYFVDEEEVIEEYDASKEEIADAIRNDNMDVLFEKKKKEEIE